MRGQLLLFEARGFQTAHGQFSRSFKQGSYGDCGETRGPVLQALARTGILVPNELLPSAFDSLILEEDFGQVPRSLDEAGQQWQRSLSVFASMCLAEISPGLRLSCIRESRISLRLHVCKPYLQLAPTSITIAYIALFGALGFGLAGIIGAGIMKEKDCSTKIEYIPCHR